MGAVRRQYHPRLLAGWVFQQLRYRSKWFHSLHYKTHLARQWFCLYVTGFTFLLWIFYGIELVFSCQVTFLLFGQIFSGSLHTWRSVLLSVDGEYKVNVGAHFFWLILHRNKQVPLLEDTYFSDPVWNEEKKLNKAQFKSLMHLELRKSVSFQASFQSFNIVQITQKLSTIFFANNSSLWLSNVTDLFTDICNATHAKQS
jgi:hypothetical protein